MSKLITKKDIAARESLFDSMLDATQAIALKGEKRLCTATQLVALTQYDIGTLVGRIEDDKNLNEEQKKEEINKLSNYWGAESFSTSLLYDLRNVSATFERKFIKEQIEQPMLNGKFLSWTHFKELQKLGTAKARDAMLKKIRKHGWSSRELALELRGRKEAAITRTGGRKPLLPKTPSGLLQKVYATVQQTDNLLCAAADPLQHTFMELSSSEFDNKFVSQLDGVMEMIEEAKDHMQATMERLTNIKQRVDECEAGESSDEELEEAAIVA